VGDPVTPTKVALLGLEFHGFHGVFDEEARFGARFVVDVELFFPYGGEDVLSETVDYSAVYDLVRREMTGRRRQLIEALAHDLARGILAAAPLVARVAVRVHKPHAPLPGVIRDVYAEVSMERA
jgi:7,8-dihydroneopterin aldolase/epimerase/oxygenase